MADTYNFTDGSITGGEAATQQNLFANDVYLLRSTIDFSLQTLDASETDVAQAIIIPAGTTVLTAYARVITTDVGAVFNIGYDGNIDQWGVSLATTADTIVGGLGSNAPVYFAAANTLDIQADASHDLDTLKIEVIAVCISHVK